MPLLEQNEIAARIRELRERRNWNTADLARHAEVDPKWLTSFEKNEMTVPSQVLVRVAEALGLRAEELLQGEDVSTAALFRRSADDDAGVEATAQADRLIDGFFALEALTRR